MKLAEIVTTVKTTLTDTNPVELTDFTKLTRSQVYLCICALLDVLIQFLESLSSRFDPITEILRDAYNQLEKLKKDSAEFRKEENEFETVHYCKHTVAAHDVTRCCHNHHNKTKKELDRVKEENRVLRIEIDESNNLLEQKEKEYQSKLAELENENSQLKKKDQARNLDLDYKTSH